MMRSLGKKDSKRSIYIKFFINPKTNPIITSSASSTLPITYHLDGQIRKQTPMKTSTTNLMRETRLDRTFVLHPFLLYAGK